MTRAEVIQMFPDATDEQITTLLNAHHKELNEDKNKAKELEETKARLAELQQQIDEAASKDLTEMEKMQKTLDEIQEKYEASQKTIKDMELKNSLLGQGVSEDDATKLIESMNAEKFDASVIGTMIANAISAHDKEKMSKTPDPSGASGKPDTRTDAEKIAEAMYANGASEQKQSVISNYL